MSEDPERWAGLDRFNINPHPATAGHASTENFVVEIYIDDLVPSGFKAFDRGMGNADSAQPPPTHPASRVPSISNTAFAPARADVDPCASMMMASAKGRSAAVKSLATRRMSVLMKSFLLMCLPFGEQYHLVPEPSDRFPSVMDNGLLQSSIYLAQVGATQANEFNRNFSAEKLLS
jgi:hypothetical protein